MIIKALTQGDLGEWDNLVEKSPQGSIFCTTKWNSLFRKEFWYYGVYDGERLCGGLSMFEDDDGCKSGILPITSFQGVLTLPPEDAKPVRKQSMATEVTECLVKNIEEFSDVRIANHYSLVDMRPFIWNGFSTSLKYTYILDITDCDAVWDGMEKDTRNVISRAVKDGIKVCTSNDVEAFDKLYAKTFERKGIPRTASKRLIEKLFSTIPCRLYLSHQNGKNLAGVVMIWDSKRAYYILGASEDESEISSFLTLWEAIKDVKLPELDFTGANNRSIGHYKKGFGGELKQYVICKKGL